MTQTTASLPRREPPHFLAPYPVEPFFADTWEHSALVIRRDDPEYFHPWITFDELDLLTSSTTIPPTNFNLARGDHPLPPASYCNGNYIDKNRALALHAAGATIILRALDQWSPGLLRLRAHAEQFFGALTQLNVYLTPPAEKSTPPHWDTHNLFVCQLYGSKRWRLFQAARTLPLRDERFQLEHDHVGPQIAEHTLHAGDTLYLPRGTIHEPVADSYSAHVSIGVFHHHWIDIAQELLTLAASAEHSPLRRSLLSLDALDDQASRDALAASLTAALATPELLAATKDRLERRFAGSRAVDLSGRLREIAKPPRVDASTCFVRRPGVALHLRNNPEGLDLCWNDRSISVRESMRSAVEHLVGCPVIRPNELPGDISTDDRKALCYALVELGAFQIAPA